MVECVLPALVDAAVALLEAFAVNPVCGATACMVRRLCLIVIESAALGGLVFCAKKIAGWYMVRSIGRGSFVVLELDEPAGILWVVQLFPD